MNIIWTIFSFWENVETKVQFKCCKILEICEKK